MSERDQITYIWYMGIAKEDKHQATYRICLATLLLITFLEAFFGVFTDSEDYFQISSLFGVHEELTSGFRNEDTAEMQN